MEIQSCKRESSSSIANNGAALTGTTRQRPRQRRRQQTSHLCLENPVHEACCSFIIARVVLPGHQSRQAALQDTVNDGRHERYDEIEHLHSSSDSQDISGQMGTTGFSIAVVLHWCGEMMATIAV